MFGLDTTMTILLILFILAAMAFEFINGFHDTANAVATVIYTRALKPRTAVIWSGFWNFVGVYIGGIAVAIGIINLLPLEILVDQNLAHNMAMIGALILTAIIWNLGTWYFGIPCSSSHTLLGSIFGVGLAYMFISSGGAALNWKKVIDAGLSLLISPIIGFGLTILLLILFKKIVKKKKFFRPANPDSKPPFWIRGVLVLTCTGVSYSHGSNDGQKGIGLIMIILIGVVPAKFALDETKNPADMLGNVNHIEFYVNKTDTSKLNAVDYHTYSELHKNVSSLKASLVEMQNPEKLDGADKFQIRKEILIIKKKVNELLGCESVKTNNALILSDTEMTILKKDIKIMDAYTEYAPWWVILLVSLSLGIGTMVGWKRIVVTIGEKIGKTHLSYAQGASAEIVASSTIGLSTALGLPVSTTHILSSGVAGSMVYEGGMANLQMKTIRNILVAWVVTIPVTIVMSGGLFLLLRYLL